MTMFLMDRQILRKEPKIEEQQKRVVLDLVDADIMIKNKVMFYFNSIAIITTIVLFVIIPWLFLTAAISALASPPFCPSGCYRSSTFTVPLFRSTLPSPSSSDR